MTTAAGPARRGTVFGLLLLLLAWEAAGRGGWVASGALPAPSQIVLQAWVDRADYPDHVLGTLRTAAAGFALGSLLGLALGLAYVRWPRLQRVMAGVDVTVFAMPAIALVPILIIALPGDAPRVVLSALSVYYPVMVAVVLGLRQTDPRLLDLVQVYGGGEFAALRWVRLRGGLPTLMSGLRVAAPAAVLGSLLAEFGSGASAGLGTYLIGSLGRADPARLWGIGLAATTLSALAYRPWACWRRALQAIPCRPRRPWARRPAPAAAPARTPRPVGRPGCLDGPRSYRCSPSPCPSCCGRPAPGRCG